VVVVDDANRENECVIILAVMPSEPVKELVTMAKNAARISSLHWSVGLCAAS
jgi:3,4-dihydroxy-2-butanone 4-phosphate synthase